MGGGICNPSLEVDGPCTCVVGWWWAIVERYPLTGLGITGSNARTRDGHERAAKVVAQGSRSEDTEARRGELRPTVPGGAVWSRIVSCSEYGKLTGHASRLAGHT